MNQPIIIAIDKVELYDYLHNGLIEQNIVVRQFVLEYLIDETLEYIGMVLENQYND